MTEPTYRELAKRGYDGLTITLLWNPNRGTYLSVRDDKHGGDWFIPTRPDRALDAFYHPFGYLAGTEGQ